MFLSHVDVSLFSSLKKQWRNVPRRGLNTHTHTHKYINKNPHWRLCKGNHMWALLVDLKISVFPECPSQLRPACDKRPMACHRVLGVRPWLANGLSWDQMTHRKFSPPDILPWGCRRRQKSSKHSLDRRWPSVKLLLSSLCLAGLCHRRVRSQHHHSVTLSNGTVVNNQLRERLQVLKRCRIW